GYRAPSLTPDRDSKLTALPAADPGRDVSRPAAAILSLRSPMQPRKPVLPTSAAAARVSLNPDAALDEAAELSRYVRRLQAHPPPLFAPESLATPCTRCQIRAWLQAEGVATEEQLQRRLRHVRQ